MITPVFLTTATERVLPSMALDFTSAVADPRVSTSRANNTATRFNSSGIIEIVNANLPRFDFDPSTLICKGQIIEEARTNLLLNSLINGTNLSTQTVTLSAVMHTFSFYGNGSVSISGGHSATVAGTGNFPSRTTYSFTPSAGSSTFTVSGDVKYAQLETGAFASSFIPTAGSSVLRNADTVTMSGVNFTSWFNATVSGSAVASATVMGGTNNTVYTFDNTASGLYANLAKVATNHGGTPGRVTFAIQAAGATTYLDDRAAQTTNNVKFNTAFSFATSKFASSINAATPATQLSGAVPASFNILRLGSHRDGTILNGWLAKFAYYAPLFTGAETQAFSK